MKLPLQQRETNTECLTDYNPENDGPSDDQPELIQYNSLLIFQSVSMSRDKQIERDRGPRHL